MLNKFVRNTTISTGKHLKVNNKADRNTPNLEATASNDQYK